MPAAGLVARFDGEYGAAALANLSSWQTSIFERTFLAYKAHTMAVCANETACELVSSHRLVATANAPGFDSFYFSPFPTQNQQTRKSPEPRQDLVWPLFAPFITCPNKSSLLRVGNAADGGKWMCSDMVRAPCTVFSIGSKGSPGSVHSRFQRKVSHC
jgi:hypothetical protein